MNEGEEGISAWREQRFFFFGPTGRGQGKSPFGQRKRWTKSESFSVKREQGFFGLTGKRD